MTGNRVFGTDAAMFWMFVLMTVANCLPVVRDGDYITLSKHGVRTLEELQDDTDKTPLTTHGYSSNKNSEPLDNEVSDINADLNKEEKSKQNEHDVRNYNAIHVEYKTHNNGKNIEHQPISLYYKHLRLHVKRSPSIGSENNTKQDELRDTIVSIEESTEELVEITNDPDSVLNQRSKNGDGKIEPIPKPISRVMRNTTVAIDDRIHGVERKVQTDETGKRGANYDDGDPTTIDVDLSRFEPIFPRVHDVTGLSIDTLYQKHGGVCRSIDGYGNQPIYIISHCPFPGLDKEIRYLCENSASSPRDGGFTLVDLVNTPVQDASGFVYRNVYCAQCAGISQPIAWTTKLVCDDIQPLEIADWTDKLSFIKQIGEPTRECQKTLTPAYPSHVRECSDVYIGIQHTSPPHRTRVGDNSKDVSPLPLSFSVLMNFGFDGKTHILFSTENYVQTGCQQSQIYDPITDKCREVSCIDGYTLIDSTCRRTAIDESDPSSTDLNLNEIKDMYQVTLTVKNVSYAELVLFALPGIEDMLKATLVNTFNISKERIENLTVNVVNATSDNGSGTTEIEVHRFVMDKPTKVSTHPKSPNESKQGTPIAVIATKPTAETADASHDGLTPPPITVYTGHDGSAEDMPDIDNRKHDNTDNSAMEDSNTTTEITNKPEYNITNTQNDQPEGNVITANDNSLWHIYTGVSLKISFLLKPAFTTNKLTEKSANSVVQSMTELINKKDFMLTVNGTTFQVESLNPAPTSMDKFCTRGDAHFYEDDQFEVLSVFDDENQTNDTRVVVKETGSQFGPGEYDLTISIDGTIGNLSRAQISSFVFVCVMPEIEDVLCGRIILNNDEFVAFANLSITFAGVIYSSREYEFANEENGTVRICAPDWSSRQFEYGQGQWALACGEAMQKVVVAESYLSFILGVISLVAMSTVLVTYGLFEKMRNLPGMNTINLTLALFLGEFVFISSGWLRPHQTWLCSGVGILLHFLFLASFFWMNVMSYDVYRTFATKCILKQIRDKKKYLPRYAIYAWGCPILIVGFCAFIDFSHLIKSVSIGYGGSVTSFDDNSWNQVTSDNGTSIMTTRHMYNIGCWIQEPVASMAAFGGPMVIILLSNAAMFTRTIICIRSSTKMTKHRVRRSSQSHMMGHDDVMLYVRMSTVMGFTWGFGLTSSLVSAFADNASKTTCIVLHCLAILFIVFNCSQGIFILFAFVFNRRVFALYKGLYNRLKRGRERPLSTCSSRSTLSISVSQTLSQRL